MSVPHFDDWGFTTYRWSLRPSDIPDVWVVVDGGKLRLSMYQEDHQIPSQPMTANEARELASALLRAADAIESETRP